MDTQETPKELSFSRRVMLMKMSLRKIYLQETGSPLPKHLENKALDAAGLLKKPEWM